LNAIEELDIVGGTAIVQAGVTLQALQEVAEAHDMWFPLDLGARGSCHLGGNAATNAGGNRVLRFGMMRNLVLGLEAVLPDGTVLTMLDRMLKNNAGFDLKQLFIGSEGTLGVITRLSLSLVPRPGWRGSSLCAVSDSRSRGDPGPPRSHRTRRARLAFALGGRGSRARENGLIGLGSGCPGRVLERLGHLGGGASGRGIL
jgi:FAD/FMN-containing dehydrogenase